MPDKERAEASLQSEAPGATRRGMLRGAAGLGAAGLAAGMLAGAVAAPAGAATQEDAGSAEHSDPLVVHINDARSGVVDLYTGTQHVRFTDHKLAARLAQAAG
jgi:hypothetical protein